ncbi:MAG: hypothetical protein HYX76_00115, partial [Acidobacteria bacterium]|nr:hypothetical protein [Acidobacteriota bacterium]
MTAETRVRRVKARRVLPLVFLTSLAVAASAQPAGQATDGVRLLLASLERALVSGDPADYITLLSPAADRSKGSSFAEANIAGGGTRAVIRERDRAALSDGSAGSGYRLVVDAFVEQGRRGRIQTWQLDVRALSAASDEWRIVDQQRLSLVEGLYRLTLNATRQYAVRNLALKAEDLLLTIPAGSAFAAESDEGITALVLRGRGTMRFSPAPKAERGQLKIFAGAETMETPFDWAFVRVNPAELESHATLNALAEQPVDPRGLARAEVGVDARAPHPDRLDHAH